MTVSSIRLRFEFDDNRGYPAVDDVDLEIGLAALVPAQGEKVFPSPNFGFTVIGREYALESGVMTVTLVGEP